MKDNTTRRNAIKVGTASIVGSSFVTIASGDTPSGEIELETTATIPTNTSIDITVFEDTDSSSTSNRQESVSIDDGTNTYQLTLLESSVAQGDTLWIEASLSTSDDSVTPELDSVTLTLPETGGNTGGGTGTANDGPDTPDDPNTFSEILNNYLVFITAVVLSFVSLGLWGKSLAVGAYLGYIAFAYLAITTQTPLLVNILYVTVVLVFIGMAFKLYRTEFGGE
jgi:hypothetical protein